MEVMVALGIFTLGFVTVAAIFPAGALMQKRATEQALAQHVADNGEAILRSLKLTYGPDVLAANTSGMLGEDYLTGWNGYYEASEDFTDSTRDYRNVVTFSMISGDTNAGSEDDLLARWPLELRSYPYAKGDVFDRDFYWLPLVQDAFGDPAAPNWQGFVFILRHNPGDTYPGNPNLDPDNDEYPYGYALSPDGEIVVPVVRCFELEESDFESFTVSPRNRDAATGTAEAIMAQLPAGTPVLLSDGTVLIVRQSRKKGNGDVIVEVRGFIAHNFADNGGRVYYAPAPTGGGDPPTLAILPVEFNIENP